MFVQTDKNKRRYSEQRKNYSKLHSFREEFHINGMLSRRYRYADKRVRYLDGFGFLSVYIDSPARFPRYGGEQYAVLFGVNCAFDTVLLKGFYLQRLLP